MLPYKNRQDCDLLCKTLNFFSFLSKSATVFQLRSLLFFRMTFLDSSSFAFKWYIPVNSKRGINIISYKKKKEKMYIHCTLDILHERYLHLRKDVHQKRMETLSGRCTLEGYGGGRL